MIHIGTRLVHLLGSAASKMVGMTPLVYRPKTVRQHYRKPLAGRNSQIHPDRMKVRPGQFMGLGRDETGRALAHFCVDYGSAHSSAFEDMMDAPLTTYVMERKEIRKAIKRIKAEFASDLMNKKGLSERDAFAEAHLCDSDSWSKMPEEDQVVIRSLQEANDALDVCFDPDNCKDLPMINKETVVRAGVNDRFPVSIHHKQYARQRLLSPGQTDTNPRLVPIAA